MIEAFIEDTNRAKSKEEVYELFLTVLKKFGYDRTIYTYMTDQPDINQKAEHGIATNYPEEWMDRYFSLNYIKEDPTFKYAISHNGPFSWDSLSNIIEFSKIEKQIMDEAKEVKLYGGLGVSIHGHFGNISGIGIASSYEKSEPNLDIIRKLNLLSRQFHMAYSDHIQENESEKKITLSAREREILLFAAEGKSDLVIAELLGIKHSTVRYHVQNIFKKTGVNERTLAVVKAIQMRLISPGYIGVLCDG